MGYRSEINKNNGREKEKERLMEITLTDLTRIGEVEMKKLEEWKKDVQKMYDRAIVKGKLGEANVLYTVREMINNEIYERKTYGKK